jgi:hypothetical protein
VDSRTPVFEKEAGVLASVDGRAKLVRRLIEALMAARG